ncbi:hypothetical protein PVAP13_5NG505486 [Panicum virgatum]|uniref:Uncharacterized protein n=1 Tax=Panicum virgatum TaxID=38727 RepID=A0A8T0S299_PANVG|nr:hypothetical protein PVAP13_5NG505486 [Panicum virgatum]
MGPLLSIHLNYGVRTYLLPSTRFVPRRSPTPQALLSLGLSKPRASGLKQARQYQKKKKAGTPTGIKARNSPAGRRHAPGGNPSATTRSLRSPLPSPQVGRRQRSLHKAPAPTRAPPSPPGRRCSGGLRTAPPSSSATSRYLSPVSPVRLLPLPPLSRRRGVPAFSGARALEFVACSLWKSGLLVRTQEHCEGISARRSFLAAGGWEIRGEYVCQSRPASVSCPPVDFC